jgi:hypothetical protein
MILFWLQISYSIENYLNHEDAVNLNDTAEG